MTRAPFPLLACAAPLGDACGAFAHAWDRASNACRNLERAARAALAEPAGGFGAATETLFDLVATSDLLPRTVPAGRIPRDFAARCLAAARLRRDGLIAEAAALRAARPIVRRKHSTGAFPEAYALAAAPRARLAALAARYPGDPEEGLARGELALPGTPFVITRTGAVHLREKLPGTAICVGPPLVSRRFGLIAPSASNRAARKRSSRAALQLGRALAVVDAAWPEAGAEIRNRTRLILPLDEPGLVSYSLLHRPGVTFINLRGKSLLDLADDLLHETAHHRLHAVEDATPLFPLRPPGEEARYWSPWRRALRPVRGIYHAAYTFAFRAELFCRIHERMNDLDGRAGPLRRSAEGARTIRDEARREQRLVARAVVDLRQASQRRLITPAGRRLLDRIGLACDPG